MKRFNITGTCFPEKHYMVDISERVEIIRGMIDQGDYFCINRGRQYGKTTTLKALAKAISDDYVVLPMSFEGCNDETFSSQEQIFSMFFKQINMFVRFGKLKDLSEENKALVKEITEKYDDAIPTDVFIDEIRFICSTNPKPIVVLIDEVDEASGFNGFLKFLGTLRKMYLERELFPTLQSVVLAGVHDIKNLKLKIREGNDHTPNSPWNIAVAFNVDMSLSETGIKGMLDEYEADHSTGMDTADIAEMLRKDTNGYPFLVSRLCMLMDEKKDWTRNGFFNAEKSLLVERNTFFDDINKKIKQYPELGLILRRILYNGDSISYNGDVEWQEICIMYGYITADEDSKRLQMANRIVETRLYNKFIDEDKMQVILYNEGAAAKMNYTQEGRLDMEHILSHFCTAFKDIYGSQPDEFIESEGRRIFLMYIRPIINGIGHYYVEAQTRDYTRTDLVIDYLGEQFVLEMKIWRGKSYNERGEKQLAAYMDYFHVKKAYMLSFCFNQNKVTGLKDPVQIGYRTLIEAIV